MARRLKVLDGGLEGFGEKKKTLTWQRDRKGKRFQEIDDSPSVDVGETMPDGGIQDDKGAEVGVSANIPPNSAELHTKPAVGEKKETKDFFRDVLISVIEWESALFQRGLAIIREIKSGEKIWKAVEGSDMRELKLGLLKKISSVNPDAEDILDEVKRLSNLQGYDIDDLKTKINSHPEVLAAREASRSDEEGRKNYGRLLRNHIRNEVRDIFRNDEIANFREVFKIALHVENVVHKGLVDIIDAPPQKTTREEEKKEPENSVEIESEVDKRKKKLIRENAEESFADILNNHFENILHRWPSGKNFNEVDIQAIKNGFEQNREEIIDDIVYLIFQELTEKVKPFEREVIDTQVFLKMREAVVKQAEKNLKKKEMEPLREQRSELVRLITEAVKFKNQFDEAEMEKVVKRVFEEDSVLKEMFPGDQFSEAISHVLNSINKFRDKK